MIRETLKSIKDNRYSYSSPTVEEVAQKMLDLKEENAQLKELNQELYEVVSHLSVYRDSIVPNSLIDEADKVLKKVRGEGE